jgi:hypothetical protein
VADPARRGIAVHEAGHAVAGHVLGLRPTYISTLRSEQHEGVVRCAAERTSREFAYAVEALSGPMAEIVLTRAPASFVWATSKSDQRNAWSYCAEAAAAKDTNPGAVLRSASLEANALMRKHAREVRELAELVPGRELAGADLASVLGAIFERS